MIKPLRLIGWLFVLPIVIVLTGCQSDGAEGGGDIGFLRTPNLEKEKLPVVNEPITLLFPTGRERQWNLAVNIIAQESPNTSRVVQKFNETVRVGPPSTIGGITQAITLAMYQNGKLYRNEIYQVKPDSLSLVAAGSGDKMTMSPPMPLLRTKAPEGQQYTWEGQITFKKATAPAKAYSRVHAAEEIVTPAGKFNAYRVDTMLTTIIEGQTAVFPSSRWIAPGVGIVRQTFKVGNAVVQKDLVSYKGS